MFEHAIVSINETTSLLIGGCQAVIAYIAKDSTYYFNHENGAWKSGPKLPEPRIRHTAGIVTDHVTNERFVIVVGGRNKSPPSNDNVLETTKILIDDDWIPGEKH